MIRAETLAAPVQQHHTLSRARRGVHDSDVVKLDPTGYGRIISETKKVF